jgi:hypothetical protein
MEFDLTQVIVALVIVFLPAIMRELRNFWHDWRIENVDVSYRLEQAAAFGVKAAAIWRKNTESSGLDAEKEAVKIAQKYLDMAGAKVDVAMIYAAVKAAYADFVKEP